MSGSPETSQRARSAVATFFRDWGATIIDADAIVRRLQRPGHRRCSRPSWSGSARRRWPPTASWTGRRSGPAFSPTLPRSARSKPSCIPRSRPSAGGSSGSPGGARPPRRQRHPAALRDHGPREIRSGGAGGRPGAGPPGAPGGASRTSADGGGRADRAPSCRQPGSARAPTSSSTMTGAGISCASGPGGYGENCSRGPAGALDPAVQPGYPQRGLPPRIPWWSTFRTISVTPRITNTSNPRPTPASSSSASPTTPRVSSATSCS